MAPNAAKAFSFRVSHFAPAQDVLDAFNTFAGSYGLKLGANAIVSGTAGYAMVDCPSGDECDNGFMLGGDITSKLWSNTPAAGSTSQMSLNLQGSLGWGKQGDASGMSAAVGIPLTWSMEQASKSKISLFFTPGYGWGKVKDDESGFDEGGTLPFFGLGGAWTSASGWGLHVGFQKVLVDEPVDGNSFGLGFSWNLK